MKSRCRATRTVFLSVNVSVAYGKGVHTETCNLPVSNAGDLPHICQYILDVKHSNLPSPACAGGFWGVVSAVKVVGIYLNGRRLLAHKAVSLASFF